MKIGLFIMALLSCLTVNSERKIENDRMIVGVYRNIKFTDLTFTAIDTSSSSCKKDLLEMIVIIGNLPKTNFELRVHEPSKKANYNSLKISETKAKTICNYLIFNGVDSNRIIPTGKQFYEPIVDSAITSFEYWINRRVELVKSNQ